MAETVNVRIEQDMWNALEKERIKMKAKEAGRMVSISDVVRACIGAQLMGQVKK